MSDSRCIDFDGLDGVLRPGAVGAATSRLVGTGSLDDAATEVRAYVPRFPALPTGGSRDFVIPVRPFTPPAQSPPSALSALLEEPATEIRPAPVRPRRMAVPALITLALATLSGGLVAIGTKDDHRPRALPLADNAPPPPPRAAALRETPAPDVTPLPTEQPPLRAAELHFPAQFTFNQAQPRALDETALHGLIGR